MKFIYLHCGEETNLRDPRRFVLNYAPKLFVKSTGHNSLIQTVKPSFFKEINFKKIIHNAESKLSLTQSTFSAVSRQELTTCHLLLS